MIDIHDLRQLFFDMWQCQVERNRSNASMTSSVSIYFDRIASNEAENDAVGGRGELLRRRGVHAHHDLSVVLHQTGAHHVQEVSLKHRLTGTHHVQEFSLKHRLAHIT